MGILKSWILPIITHKRDLVDSPNAAIALEPYQRELELLKHESCWEWNTLWDEQLNHTWEPYWAAVPLGSPDFPLLTNKQNKIFDSDWIEKQQEIAHTLTDYRILISRSDRRPQAQLYAFGIQQKIPQFLLPLQSEDTEPLVDLQTLLAQVYDQARFDLAINYTQEAIPPLKEQDRIWADALLQEQGRR